MTFKYELRHFITLGQIFKNEMAVSLSVVLFCCVISLLLYTYMALPRKGNISDYSFVDSQSHFDKEERKPGVINLTGWFFVDNQNASDQLKKELVLNKGKNYYSYPVRYISRPDVAKNFPKVYKNDKRLGFSTQISTRFIEDGIYHIYIKYIYNNKEFISDLNKEIEIK